MKSLLIEVVVEDQHYARALALVQSHHYTNTIAVDFGMFCTSELDAHDYYYNVSNPFLEVVNRVVFHNLEGDNDD